MSSIHAPALVVTVGALLGLAIVGLVARWLRGRAYRSLFRIPARRDDVCACRDEQETVPIRLRRDGFDLPSGWQAGGQTAFLTLTIEATMRGTFSEPFVEVRHGEVRFRQHFERAARGRRQLNLSPIFQSRGTGVAGSAGDRVVLCGRGLRWSSEAALSLFTPLSVDDAKIVVLAPHPDDAEIAAFGIYARQSSPAWVATLTGGDRGMASLATVVPSAAASRWSADLRVWDSLTIPQLGGVARERCVNLVVPDGRLRDMRADPTLAFTLECEHALSRATLRARNAAVEFQRGNPACAWADVIQDLRSLLEKADPDVVVSPHPLVDGHHDHVFTTVALDEAVRSLPPRERLFLLYVVHRRDVPLYPFGPADTLVSLPPWTDQEWLADSVYSRPVAEDLQRAKFFAIEASHDLRAYETSAPKTLRQTLRVIRAELAGLVGGIGRPVGSFLRRAARPNEIYWVVSQTSLSELVQRALADAKR